MDPQMRFQQNFLLGMTLVNLASSVVALLLFFGLGRGGRTSLLLASGLLLLGVMPLWAYLRARSRPGYALPVGV